MQEYLELEEKIYSICRRDEKYKNLVRTPERKRTLETPV
jgi:hypothetical protein